MSIFFSEQNSLASHIDNTSREGIRSECLAASNRFFDDYIAIVSRINNDSENDPEKVDLYNRTSVALDHRDETPRPPINPQRIDRVNRNATVSGDALNARYRPTLAVGVALTDFQRTNHEGPISAPVDNENLEERELAVLSALDSLMTNSPHADQFNRDLAAFLRRPDLTRAQRVASLENLVAITSRLYDPTNSHRSGLSDLNLQTAIAGGINDIAHPTQIDQGYNETCNFTVLQEGQATLDPVRYTAQLREAALHGTYTGNDGFRAIIPPAMLTPHAEAIGAQDADLYRNFSSQLLQAGGLNHFWQQRGQYYTDCDERNEMRYTFDPSQANPFTTRNGSPGTCVFLNDVGFMGRNFGLQGRFLIVRPEWLTPEQSLSLDSAIIVVRTQQQMLAAMRGRPWSILATHSGDRYFTGADGVGHEGGSHVISATLSPDGVSVVTSNQWGSASDRSGTAEEVWQVMAFDHMSRWRCNGRIQNDRRFTEWDTYHRNLPDRVHGLIRQSQ